MDKQEVQEIIDCLPKGRTVFYYFKDRYAPLLLSLALNEPVAVRELRDGPLSKLLRAPTVKALLKQRGDGILSREILESAWAEDYECYVLSLDSWGGPDRGWTQTSRRGWNLVLQLNFSNKHDQEYRRLIDPKGEYIFDGWGHPVAKGKYKTLAWCRIDLDASWTHALIEEVQNDWLRKASNLIGWLDDEQTSDEWMGVKFKCKDLIRYVEETLKVHNAVWSEALLSAAIWFLRHEIGVRRIFYHTDKTGAALKKIRWSKPPRSLYSALPRKFCFQRTHQRPEFVELSSRCPASRQLKKDATFYLLEL